MSGYVRIALVVFLSCLTASKADTFTHRQSGKVFHGFATQKSIGGKTLVYNHEQDGFKPVVLAEYNIAPDVLGRRDTVAIIQIKDKEVMLSINTNLDRPQARRVTFTTQKHAIFYLELAIDKTEFIQLHEFEKQGDINPDEIIAQTAKAKSGNASSSPEQADDDAANLLDELGI